MTELVDRTLALRWLARARRAALAVQCVLMVFAERTEIHLHSPALVIVMVAWAGVDVAQALRARRVAPGPRLVGVLAAIDLAALSGVLLLSGGQHSPLLFGYLGFLAILAMALPPRQAWAAALVAMALQAFVVFWGAEVVGLPPQDESTAHRLGHIVTFELSAAAITWVVTLFSAAVRERAERERQAERQREVTERLAALGTLAAGVAHELGTPLGAIQLLAEKARRRGRDPEVDATMVTLLEQVARSRALLDRLRGRDAGGAPRCTLDVERWVAEWRRGTADVDVHCDAPVPAVAVLGAEESWRAALWVALDNARRAGARTVHIQAVVTDRTVELRAEDDGRGLDEAEARRVGEPFYTGWGGTGLGLFVSRTFAQSVGGDISVEPAPPRGACTRLLLPRATP